MSGLMIYLPEGTQPSADRLAELGLAGLLEPGIAPLPVSPGPKTPDGTRGTLVFFDNPQRPDLATPRQVDLDTQEWFGAPPKGDLPALRYWVGYETENPPGPEDLARRTLSDGEAVILCDERPWVVPIANYLPQRLTRHPLTGEEQTKPAPRHREFVDRANELFVYFLSDEFQAEVQQAGKVVIPGGLEFAALALAKNYRVNIDVLDALGLIGEWQAFDIARVACGLPATVHDGKPAQKKTGHLPTAAAGSTR